jgi:hypothetical protein
MRFVLDAKVGYLMQHTCTDTKRSCDPNGRGPLAETVLGTGLGDRFEGRQARSGVFEGGMRQADETE